MDSISQNILAYIGIFSGIIASAIFVRIKLCDLPGSNWKDVLNVLDDNIGKVTAIAILVGILVIALVGTFPIPFFLLLFVSLVSWIVWRINRQFALQEFKKEGERLLSSESYKYIKNFSAKHNYTSCSLNIPGEELNTLRDLMAEKGFNFDIEELRGLIDSELDKQNYMNFKAKMMHNNPDGIESFLKRFLELCGENYLLYMDSFQRLLQEKHYPVDKEVLRQRIDELRQKLKLEHFEKQLNNSQHQPLTIYDLDSATGYEFENFLNILFKKMGYKVENTKLSGDQGADLVVEKFGEKIVVQAKRYNNKVTNRGVQEVVAAIKHYKADKGMVITTNEFTRSAIKLASSNNIKLIDRGELSKLISTYL